VARAQNGHPTYSYQTAVQFLRIIPTIACGLCVAGLLAPYARPAWTFEIETRDGACGASFWVAKFVWALPSTFIKIVTANYYTHFRIRLQIFVDTW
jgi:hypothetical protein